MIIIDVYDSPVIIEVPHFASLRGKEREIIILRSDNGETWREHTLEASEEAVQEVLNESFQGEGNASNVVIHVNLTDNCFPCWIRCECIGRIHEQSNHSHTHH